jgi:uncharacterized protein YkwD
MFLAAARTPGRVLARTILFGTSVLFAAGLLTWAPSAVTAWNQGAAEGTLWQLLNGARSNNGLAPLQQHSTLVGLARWRSQDMLNRDYFSHTIPGCGCPVYPYYDQNGIVYVWGGENIGWNSGLDDASSPVGVHNNFMASAGHRANVLHPSFTHGGVGGAAADNTQFQGYVQNTRMYTELFMQAPGAAPAPAPAPAAPAPAPAVRPAPAPAAPRPGGAPAAPAAPAAPTVEAPAAEPTPMEVAVAAPRRPQSAAVDGTSELVSRPRAAIAARFMYDEMTAARATASAARQTKADTAADAPDPRSAGRLEVTAAEDEEPGLLDGFFAFLASLFG